MVAIELEMPFGDDPNDLPLAPLQQNMNKSLWSLLDVRTQQPPTFKHEPSNRKWKCRPATFTGIARSATRPVSELDGLASVGFVITDTDSETTGANLLVRTQIRKLTPKWLQDIAGNVSSGRRSDTRKKSRYSVVSKQRSIGGNHSFTSGNPPFASVDLAAWRPPQSPTTIKDPLRDSNAIHRGLSFRAVREASRINSVNFMREEFNDEYLVSQRGSTVSTAISAVGPRGTVTTCPSSASDVPSRLSLASHQPLEETLPFRL